jgi:hypothetical protein
MGREDLVWIVVAAVLLAAGFLAGQRWAAPTAEAVQTADPTGVEADLVVSEAEMLESESAFRARFWQGRSLDLAVQAALVLVGALSISALLPRSGEEERP